jgi:hypothetical protein
LSTITQLCPEPSDLLAGSAQPYSIIETAPVRGTQDPGPPTAACAGGATPQSIKVRMEPAVGFVPRAGIHQLNAVRKSGRSLNLEGTILTCRATGVNGSCEMGTVIT